MTNKIKLSIITASYNSERYIAKFIKNIKIELLKITDNYEIIIVDDNSIDNSTLEIKKEISSDNKIKLIELSKNSGLHKSLLTGIEYSTGDIIYTTDIDLQVKANNLIIFYEKLTQNKFDHIYGVYLNDSSKNLFHYIFKNIFIFLFKFFLSNKNIIKKSSTMIFNQNFKNHLMKFKEKEFTISGITSLIGNSVDLPIKRNINKHTSYSFSKRLDEAFDLLTNHSRRPIYIVIILSFISAICTFLIGLYMILSKFFYDNIVDGYTSIIVTIAFLGSLIMLSFGFVLILLFNILIESKQRPRILIKKIIDDEKE